MWHECSLFVSDACGCAAWHVAPTLRIAMPFAMQARLVRHVRKVCQVRRFRHVARALGSPSAPGSPLPPRASQVRTGAKILPLGNFAIWGFDSGAVRIDCPSNVGIACRGLQLSMRGRVVAVGLACRGLQFSMPGRGGAVRIACCGLQSSMRGREGTVAKCAKNGSGRTGGAPSPAHRWPRRAGVVFHRAS